SRRISSFLKKEGIDVAASTVYNTLKRNSLNTLELRLANRKEQYSIEPALALRKDHTPATGSMEEWVLPAKEPKSVARDVIDRAPIHPVSTVTQELQITKVRSPWILTLLNVFLFVLLAFLAFYTVQNVRTPGWEPEAVVIVKPAPLIATEEPETASKPLDSYRTIWDRNLFNISNEKPPVPQKKISLDEIVLAKKELGLKLVGTVVANDKTLSRAIVHNQKTREQDSYSEGDEAGEVTVKKILRNKVVITTAEGDQLLIVSPEDFGKPQSSVPSQQQASRSFKYQRQTLGSGDSSSSTTGSTVPRVRTSSIRLERDEVEASLADIDTLMQQVRISPYRKGDQSSGFRISNIPAKSALRKMGLRSRDVIVGINGEDIKGPEQAAEFFGKISEGGEITIKLKRRRRTRQINLNIE
ncbi:MAG: type II secretion system protein N, partial [Desulfobacterales bacterium]